MTRWKEHLNELKPAIPFFFAYDVGGAQEFGVAGAFHTWDLTKIKTSDFTYTPDTDRIYFNNNTSGFYKITFNASWHNIEDADDVSTYLYLNGDVLPGSMARDFLDTISEDEASQSIAYIAYLKKGDYIQVFSITGADTTASTFGNSSRIIIEFIPMLGWNNSNAGKIEYKGGVMR